MDWPVLAVSLGSRRLEHQLEEGKQHGQSLWGWKPTARPEDSTVEEAVDLAKAGPALGRRGVSCYLVVAAESRPEELSLGLACPVMALDRHALVGACQARHLHTQTWIWFVPLPCCRVSPTWHS